MRRNTYVTFLFFKIFLTDPLLPEDVLGSFNSEESEEDRFLSPVFLGLLGGIAMGNKKFVILCIDVLGALASIGGEHSVVSSTAIPRRNHGISLNVQRYCSRLKGMYSSIPIVLNIKIIRSEVIRTDE